MSYLTGVPCLNDPNQGFVIDTTYEENDLLRRRLKELDKLDDEETVCDDETRKEVDKKTSLVNVLSDVSAIPMSVAKNGVLIEPPPYVFEGIAKKMTPITNDGGLLKLIRIDGYPDCPINETDYVTFNYLGWQDGKTEPFSSSYYQQKSIERQIGGVGPVFIGLDLALSSMKKGEVAFFLTCPAYSYGEQGTYEEENWPQIKGDEWLLWKIEVANVIAAAEHVTDIFGLTPDDRIRLPFSQIFSAVTAQRQLGKDAFGSQRYSQAKKYFERAAKLLVEPRMLHENEVVQKKSLLSKLFCNIAVSIYKMELNQPENQREYQDIYENAASAVSFDETNAKAWYWGGLALRHLNRFDESREYLSKAAKLNPRSTEIGDEMLALEKDCRGEKARETGILKKMIGVDKEQKTVRKIPAEIENLVPSNFRTLIMTELEKVQAQADYRVQFDLSAYSKSEITYINAAIRCCDDAPIHVHYFTSLLGSDIIEITKKSDP